MAVMDVEEGEVQGSISKQALIDTLVDNETIYFKSQQRGDKDLTKEEKSEVASDLFERSKLNFLIRFGKYVKPEQLQLFDEYKPDPDVALVLQDLERYHSDKEQHVHVRNRRYEALKQLIADDTYFSETEMMKRNPLLYEQLVGQYLTEDEKRQRDKISRNDFTMVKILMEGIERDESESKRLAQESLEDDAMEEEDSDSDEEKPAVVKAPGPSNWGEIKEETSAINRNAYCSRVQEPTAITSNERHLLQEEFITTMYQQFLDGKDTDFDYGAVDNNVKYDNLEILELDAEEKYFDSEDPADADAEQPGRDESSEDELDMYMNSLNQHPSVLELSKHIEKL